MAIFVLWFNLRLFLSVSRATHRPLCKVYNESIISPEVHHHRCLVARPSPRTSISSLLSFFSASKENTDIRGPCVSTQRFLSIPASCCDPPLGFVERYLRTPRRAGTVSPSGRLFPLLSSPLRFSSALPSGGSDFST